MVNVLLGGLDLAINHDHVAVHIGLGGFGSADGRLETTEAFFAGWGGKYLSWALMPIFCECLFLVLPDLSEEECSDCII
jgi:hypothetical protein